ncbi:hypothetical protein Bca4012_025938 [Brassica carinata]
MASRKVVDTGVRDLISSLPDEVLGNILSLVSTKLVLPRQFCPKDGNIPCLCKTLVNLTLSHGFYLEGGCLPSGSVFFPALKTLTLIATGYGADYMFDSLISGCPVLEELFIRYGDRPHGKEREFDRTSVLFETPSLLFLDYSGYVQEHYTVDFSSLLEARLDLRLWESPIEFYFDYENDGFGDATILVLGLSNVKTLHLSSHSLEVLHSCCSSIPLFSNLTGLSFESDEKQGWQVLPLLLKNSSVLETLVIKGLVHKVTDKCGDVCACILKKKKNVVYGDAK